MQIALFLNVKGNWYFGAKCAHVANMTKTGKRETSSRATDAEHQERSNDHILFFSGVCMPRFRLPVAYSVKNNCPYKLLTSIQQPDIFLGHVGRASLTSTGCYAQLDTFSEGHSWWQEKKTKTKIPLLYVENLWSLTIWGLLHALKSDTFHQPRHQWLWVAFLEKAAFIRNVICSSTTLYTLSCLKHILFILLTFFHQLNFGSEQSM